MIFKYSYISHVCRLKDIASPTQSIWDIILCNILGNIQEGYGFDNFNIFLNGTHVTYINIIRTDTKNVRCDISWFWKQREYYQTYIGFRHLSITALVPRVQQPLPEGTILVGTYITRHCDWLVRHLFPANILIKD